MTEHTPHQMLIVSSIHGTDTLMIGDGRDGSNILLDFRTDHPRATIETALAMAAAPDLLAALEDLVGWMDASNLTNRALTYKGVEYSVVTNARAVIAKAKSKGG